MKELPDLSELDSKGKDALIGELWAEIQKLRQQAEKKPKKNTKNSSLPPLFLEDTTIPPTNNSSEQALRWSVIFRKVTNCFRSEWGRDLFAAVRSVVNTGRRQGLSALDSILAALDPLDSLFSLS